MHCTLYNAYYKGGGGFLQNFFVHFTFRHVGCFSSFLSKLSFALIKELLYAGDTENKLNIDISLLIFQEIKPLGEKGLMIFSLLMELTKGWWRCLI